MLQAYNIVNTKIKQYVLTTPLSRNYYLRSTGTFGLLLMGSILKRSLTVRGALCKNVSTSIRLDAAIAIESLLQNVRRRRFDTQCFEVIIDSSVEVPWYSA